MKSSNDSAIPTILGLLSTAAEKVKTSKGLIGTVKSSADFVSGSELEEALTDFAGETAKLDAANQDVVQKDLEAQMARNEQDKRLRRWSLRRRALLTAVRLACDGSAQRMKALGFGVLDLQDTPLAVVPEGLQRRKRQPAGVATVVWRVQPGVKTFMVQYATDPSDPETYSTPKSSSRASFSIPGQQPGATLHVRVHAIDPRLPVGQTEWCEWLAVKAGV